MIDIFIALLLVRALAISLIRRFAPAIVASVAAIALFVLLVEAGWYGRRADELGRAGVAMLVVFGPSALPGAAKGVVLSAQLGAHPHIAHAILAGILLAGFVITSRHAERASPISEEYVRRHHTAICLLVPALPVLIQLCSFGLAQLLSSPF